MPVTIFIRQIDQMIIELREKSNYYQTAPQISTLEKLRERVLQSNENK